MRPTLNIGYLVTGLVFLGLSGTWLLDETGVIDPEGFQWLVPAVLLGAGLVGLFASLGRGIAGRRRTEPAPAATVVQDQHTVEATADHGPQLHEHESSEGTRHD